MCIAFIDKSFDSYWSITVSVHFYTHYCAWLCNANSHAISASLVIDIIALQQRTHAVIRAAHVIMTLG